MSSDLKSPPGNARRIGDYGLIGDCRTAALVSRNGSIDWLCLPNFPSSSIFARLLDERAGYCAFEPVGPGTVTHRYVDNTAVLETTFTTSTGSARILDCLPVIDGIERLRPEREILRIVEGISGMVQLQLTVAPRPDYARLQTPPRCRGKLGWSYSWHNEMLVVRTEFDLAQDGDDLTARVTVQPGQRRRLSLAYVQGEPAVIPPLGSEADRRLEATVAWWQDWTAVIAYTGLNRDPVVRSAITLKLLSFAPSGAIVAAPTTSLPETVGGSRNWDYRYCWLRDAGLTMQALVGLGIDQDAESFLEWLLHATRLTWPKLRIMYDVYGRTGLEEKELPHLAGYRQSRPVRIGNGAYKQEQTDVYGEVVAAAAAYVEAGGTIDRAGARMLAGLGETVRNAWRKPDSGIWEIRGEPRQYTFSKLMCWTALDRLLTLHDRGIIRLAGDPSAYQMDRDLIGEMIEQRGYNREIDAYTSELDGDKVDASLLLMSTVGYRTARDPRVVATRALIDRRLGHGGLLLRYEAGIDGLSGEEEPFGICSFWAVEQLADTGDADAAQRQFEHLLSFANPLGLFAEEIDARTGEAVGNFPQAFTHVGLINVAIAIERARSGRRQT